MNKHIEALRAAFESQNAWNVRDAAANLLAALEQQGEAVGKVIHTRKVDTIASVALNDVGKNLPEGTKLYTHPAPSDAGQQVERALDYLHPFLDQGLAAPDWAIHLAAILTDANVDQQPTDTEREQVEQEAALWRFLRRCQDGPRKPFTVMFWGDEPWEPASGAEMQAAVEAAMKPTGGGGEQ